MASNFKKSLLILVCLIAINSYGQIQPVVTPSFSIISTKTINEYRWTNKSPTIIYNDLNTNREPKGSLPKGTKVQARNKYSLSTGESLVDVWIDNNELSGSCYVLANDLNIVAPAVSAKHTATINDTRWTNKSPTIVYDNVNSNRKSTVHLPKGTKLYARGKYTLSSGETLVEVWTYNGEKMGYVYAHDLNTTEFQQMFSKPEIRNVVYQSDGVYITGVYDEGTVYLEAIRTNSANGQRFQDGFVITRSDGSFEVILPSYRLEAGVDYAVAVVAVSYNEQRATSDPWTVNWFPRPVANEDRPEQIVPKPDDHLAENRTQYQDPVSEQHENHDGYIMRIEGDKIYLNVYAQDVKKSDIFSVMSLRRNFTDAKTGRSIEIEPEVVGQIIITNVTGKYSVGKVYGDTTTELEAEMTLLKTADVFPVSNSQYVNNNEPVHNAAPLYNNPQPVYNSNEVTMMVAPVELNFTQSENTKVGNAENAGYIGDYVSAALMQHLLKSNKIHLVDGSILSTQQNESNTGMISGQIDDNHKVLQYGKISGVRYLVKITMQKPDVVDVSNSISVKGMAKTATSLAVRPNRSPNQQVQQFQNTLPDKMDTKRIKVSVSIVTHIVDLQTGKILFMTNGIGTAKGTPTIGLVFEYGQADFNSKETIDFEQTVTGKAVDDAFNKIWPKLNEFINKKL